MFDTPPTIAAREATPGTEVLITSSITTDHGVLAHFEWVTVHHWQPCADGLAGLVSTHSQWCGQFAATDRIPVRAR